MNSPESGLVSRGDESDPLRVLARDSRLLPLRRSEKVGAGDAECEDEGSSPSPALPLAAPRNTHTVIGSPCTEYKAAHTC